MADLELFALSGRHPAARPFFMQESVFPLLPI